MKILTITDELPPHVLGGSGRIAWETSLGLTKLGHSVTILTAAPDGTFPMEYEGMMIGTIPTRGRRWAHWRGVFSRSRERDVLRILDEVQPDIIHAHGLAWQIGYRWIAAAVKRNIPVFYTCHGVMHVAYSRVKGDEQSTLKKDLALARWEYNPLRNFFVKRALDQTHMLCVSDALRDWNARHGYENTTTLHNGIDLGSWEEVASKQEARQQWNLPENTTIFLLAGRVGIDKGSSLIDRVLPEDAHLVVAGTADLREFHRTRERVTFLPGLQPEGMRLLYAAVDAVLVPSIYLDPFPTVCLEAMACKRPVIATTMGGAKEAVADGTAGWVIDPHDEQAWRNRLQWVMDHRDELPALGEQARSHVEQHFSLDRYLSQLTTHYEHARTAIHTAA